MPLHLCWLGWKISNQMLMLMLTYLVCRYSTHRPPQQFSSAAGPPIVTARGEASVIKLYFNHENLPHVQDCCRPCKEKEIEEWKSQRKGHLTYACQACKKRKIPCHKLHPLWALPMLRVMKGVVHS